MQNLYSILSCHLGHQNMYQHIYYFNIQHIASLTWDQGPVLHSGGQSLLLHICTWAGVLTGQRECATTSSFWKDFFWTHWIKRLCCPPPQDLLHVLHSPVDQLKRENTLIYYQRITIRHPLKPMHARSMYLTNSPVTKCHAFCWCCI